MNCFIYLMYLLKNADIPFSHVCICMCVTLKWHSYRHVLGKQQEKQDFSLSTNWKCKILIISSLKTCILSVLQCCILFPSPHTLSSFPLSFDLCTKWYLLILRNKAANVCDLILILLNKTSSHIGAISGSLHTHADVGHQACSF